MMRVTHSCALQYRASDNLPTMVGYGRMMSGFMTPYRHWMWRQNELWRNVHEAQFEHLRRVYRRQWFESFRVNADEYIHKYNITKAATLAQWEEEMHAQDKARLERMHKVQANRKLKAKHTDLKREGLEREFFHWYERASERLQAMEKIPYIPRDKIGEHIDKELNKYVAGKDKPYPLNFVGQMPLLEDAEGNIVQVPSGLMANHFAERPTASGSEYVPPAPDSGADHLTGVVSGEAHSLAMGADAAERTELGSAAQLDRLQSSVMEDMAQDEARLRDEVSDSTNEMDTEESEISRRKYVERGKVSRRDHWKASIRSTTIAPESISSVGTGDGMTAGTRRSKRKTAPGPATVAGGKDARRRMVAEAIARHKGTGSAPATDATAGGVGETDESSYLRANLAPSEGAPEVKVGEIVTQVPKIRARLRLPTQADVEKHAIMKAQAGGASIGGAMSKDKQSGVASRKRK